MLTIDTVAVVGASEAGAACAVLAALAGCHVRLHDPSPEALDRAFELVRGRVEWALAAGALTRSERQRILDGVLFTPDLEEAVTAADLVVEADEARDAAAAARERCRRLSALVRASTALAAAGTASPEALAEALPHPGRVVGIRLADVHGPVPRLEVAASAGTLSHVLARTAAFAERVNRAARTVPSGGAGGPR